MPQIPRERLSPSGQFLDVLYAENLAQEDWFIDAVNGDDTADGSTADTALASWAELRDRWGPNPRFPDIDITVALLSDLDETLEFDGAATLSPRRTLRIVGTETVLATGTLTGVTAINRAANQFQEIEDSALAAWSTAGPDGSSLLGRLIRLTGGTGAGGFAWLQDEDPGGAGSDVARTSGFVDGIASPSAPGVGSEWEVVRLTRVSALNLNIVSLDITGGPFALTLESIDVDDPDGFNFAEAAIVSADGSFNTAEFINCSFNAGQLRFGGTNVLRLTNCCLRKGTTTDLFCGGFTTFVAGLFDNAISLRPFAPGIELRDDVLVNGSITIDAGRRLFCTAVGFIGPGSGIAVQVDAGGVLDAGDAGIYGSGYARIVRLQPGAGATFLNNPPTAVSTNDPNNTQLGDGSAIPYAGGAPDWVNGATAAGSYVAENL